MAGIKLSSFFSCCGHTQQEDGRAEELPEACWKPNHPAANAVRDLYAAETDRRRTSLESAQYSARLSQERHDQELAKQIQQRSSDDEALRKSAECARTHSSNEGSEPIALQKAWQRKSAEEASVKPVLVNRPRRTSLDTNSQGSNGSRASAASSVSDLLTDPNLPKKPFSTPRHGRIGTVPVVHE